MAGPLAAAPAIGNLLAQYIPAAAGAVGLSQAPNQQQMQVMPGDPAMNLLLQAILQSGELGYDKDEVVPPGGFTAKGPIEKWPGIDEITPSGVRVIDKSHKSLPEGPRPMTETEKWQAEKDKKVRYRTEELLKERRRDDMDYAEQMSKEQQEFQKDIDKQIEDRNKPKTPKKPNWKKGVGAVAGAGIIGAGTLLRHKDSTKTAIPTRQDSIVNALTEIPGESNVEKERNLYYDMIMQGDDYKVGGMKGQDVWNYLNKSRNKPQKKRHGGKVRNYQTGGYVSDYNPFGQTGWGGYDFGFSGGLPYDLDMNPSFDVGMSPLPPGMETEPGGYGDYPGAGAGITPSVADTGMPGGAIETQPGGNIGYPGGGNAGNYLHPPRAGRKPNGMSLANQGPGTWDYNNDGIVDTMDMILAQQQGVGQGILDNMQGFITGGQGAGPGWTGQVPAGPTYHLSEGIGGQGLYPNPPGTPVDYTMGEGPTGQTQVDPYGPGGGGVLPTPPGGGMETQPGGFLEPGQDASDYLIPPGPKLKPAPGTGETQPGGFYDPNAGGDFPVTDPVYTPPNREDLSTQAIGMAGGGHVTPGRPSRFARPQAVEAPGGEGNYLQPPSTPHLGGFYNPGDHESATPIWGENPYYEPKNWPDYLSDHSNVPGLMEDWQNWNENFFGTNWELSPADVDKSGGRRAQGFQEGGYVPMEGLLLQADSGNSLQSERIQIDNETLEEELPEGVMEMLLALLSAGQLG